MSVLSTFGLTLVLGLSGQIDPCVRADETAAAAADANRDVDALLQVLVNHRRVPPAFVQSARQRLASLNTDVLPKIAKAMHQQPLRTANWLRSAGDEIVDHAIANSRALPVAELRKIAEDVSLSAASRQMASRWIERVDPDWWPTFLRERLSDPVFGADAVALVIDRATALRSSQQDDAARQLLSEAFTASKLPDQAETIAKKLKELGRDVPLQAHLGLLRTWQVIGPFPGKSTSDRTPLFDSASPIDLSAKHAGKAGEVTWKSITLVPGELSVNLKQHVAETDDAVTYTTTTIVSEQDREVELRGSGDDNLQVWLNGELVIDSAEFHQRLRTDKHRARVRLRSGANQILVKVCEVKLPPGPPSGSPPRWQFALRIVTPDGKGLDLPNR